MTGPITSVASKHKAGRMGTPFESLEGGSTLDQQTVQAINVQSQPLTQTFSEAQVANTEPNNVQILGSSSGSAPSRGDGGGHSQEEVIDEDQTTGAAALSVDPDYKSWFPIIFSSPPPKHKAHRRCATLDTGSSIDAISQRIVDECHLETEPYSGGMIRPCGGSCMPLLQVSLGWKVHGKRRTFRTTFVVLEGRFGEDFDFIIGNETIKNYGFLQRNKEMYLIHREGEVSLTPLVPIDDAGEQR
ncbi:MAG: hypothetical protein Q9220_000378 [cf. Caloplaca sp. 1 TL-2023]